MLGTGEEKCLEMFLRYVRVKRNYTKAKLFVCSDNSPLKQRWLDFQQGWVEHIYITYFMNIKGAVMLGTGEEKCLEMFLKYVRVKKDYIGAKLLALPDDDSLKQRWLDFLRGWAEHDWSLYTEAVG